ncbi:hypothetical protein CVD28_01345 [Bacillus sp. M6-12]|uniref:helix-turn-helix domain-containing protein n=1 Tax=Bacillus sp. M6-12 TaxID=2054166 RepID=UPI000C77FB4D|nr:helix-turn-helix transcriptional regulator [Bacillus sp. M6-12]PLS19079.1 hypothetical protein CVD28_01345 [Bacillus sp. M6-12]
MVQYLNEMLDKLVELKKLGENINEQFKTIQDLPIEVNQQGVKLDGALIKFFKETCHRPAMDGDYIYIEMDLDKIFRFRYVITGDTEEVIWMNMNTIEKIDDQLTKPLIFFYWETLSPTIKYYIFERNDETDNWDNTGDSFSKVTEALNELDNRYSEEESQHSEWILAQFLEEKLNEKGISKSELADKIDIKYKTLISKFKINSFTGEELVRMAIALDLDLNELKSSYMSNEKLNQIKPDKDLKYIASLVKIGFTSGLVPAWELDVPQKQLYPLNRAEQNDISEQLEKGYVSGYLKGEHPRAWNLKINNKELIKVPTEKEILLEEAKKTFLKERKDK